MSQRPSPAPSPAFLRSLSLLFTLTLASLPQLQATPLSVEQLRCEYSTTPLDIDAKAPQLSWRLSAREAGAKQRAFQILVASSLDILNSGKGDLWDSGQRKDARTHGIKYEGKALTSEQTVYWKLRTWNQNDEISAWSAPSTWSMGILDSKEWRAQWLCSPTASEALLLRGEFEVGQGLRRAIAYSCGLGSYELRLNGQKVGTALLGPGWTNYDKTTLYDAEEVSGLLRPGKNAAGLSLGNGMYNVVRRNRFAKFTKSFGPLRAIFMLRLEYEDGRIQYVGTDETWKTNPGPCTYNGIYGGEDFDARLLQSAWDKPGFDDRTWTQAVAFVRPAATLRGHSFNAQPVREVETRKPIAITQLTDTISVYDLGQNTAYIPRLKVSGPAGSTVRLIPAEVVDEKGQLVRTTMGGLHRGINWWQYTKATEAEETWFPQFFYVGCRYLQVELIPPGAEATPAIASLTPSPLTLTPEARGKLPRLVSLEGAVIQADTEAIGHFASSDPLLNQIRELVRWAQRSNMVSVLTDCPHREKLGWIEQFHLNGPAIRYEFDMNRLFTKAMADMASAQTEEGLIPNIAPEYADFKGTFRGAAEWGAAFILVAWQQYLYSGDATLLEKHYPAMKRYVAYLESRTVEGILSDGLGDWYDLGPKKPGKSQNTPPPVTATAFLYHDTERLSQIADLLGHKEDVATYAAKAQALRLRYNKAFFNENTNSYATGSQCANALALVFHLAPENKRAEVFASLLRDLEAHGMTATAGDVGFRYLLRALADEGRSDLILRLVTQTEKPGYAWQLAKGATSLTESWDANRGASQNHFMLGQVTEWLYHDLLGLAPDPRKPGFVHALLQPNPVAGLSWCEGSYDSLQGLYKIRWERKEQRLRYTVSIPPNCTATLSLPCAKGSAPLAVLPSGEKSAIHTSMAQTGLAQIELEAGTHCFESELP